MSLSLRRLAPAVTAVATGLLLASCDRGASGSSADAAAGADSTGGTLVLVVPANPGTLLPTRLSSIQGKQITDLVFERLAEIGPSLNTFGDEGFAPRLASSWSWKDDSTAISFHLDPRARFHDGHPVRAEDVRFTFELFRDPAVNSDEATYLTAVDSVTTPDSLTATVWFSHHYPEQFYDAAGRVSILPEHLLRDAPRDHLESSPLATAPVGSGPFRFVRLEPGTLIELAANTSYHLGRPHLDRFVMAQAPNPVAATTQLFAGEADMYEAIQPTDMAQFTTHPDVVPRMGPGMSYSFVSFNLKDPADRSRPHPLLADRSLRRALTLLVDRPAIVRSAWDSLASVAAGPFPRALPTADTNLRQLDYDPARAAQLLDSLGWRDHDGDGVRDRNGRALELSILVPTSSEFRKKLAVLLQDQMAKGGVRLHVEALEYQTFGQRMGKGQYDATIATWVLGDGSPAGFRNTWGAAGARPGGQNFGRYVNTAVDAEVDSALVSFAAADRRAHFSRAYQMVLDDAPAIWLYEPMNTFGLSRRFRTPLLRAAGWWLDLPQWSVRPGMRIARDAPPAAAGPDTP